MLRDDCRSYIWRSLRRQGRHEIVLTLGGSDRFVIAQLVADALNSSRMETPVETLKGLRRAMGLNPETGDTLL